MSVSSICRSLIVLTASIGLLRADDSSATIVATVNGKAIPAEQLQWQFFLNQLPAGTSDQERQQLLQRLIDRELIRQFLVQRKVSADSAQVEHQLTVIQKLVAKRGEQVQDVLARLHLSEQQLRDYLALPIAWDAYVQSVLTEPQIAAEWEAHRLELDGTRVRASQIVRILPASASPEEWQAATKLLADVREKILSGQVAFAAAAQELSQSPSGKQGGELGEFEYRGRVDAAIADAAFELKPGEISPPFRGRHGVHLVQTQERIPGQFSLEDVRPEIIRRLSERLWEETARRERSSARIEIQKP